MAIDFNHERWQAVKKNTRDWWDGKLGRPLINIALTGRDPGRLEPKLKCVAKENFYDLKLSPEDIVDRWDFNLSSQEYLGDAFPGVWPDFGPGVL